MGDYKAELDEDELEAAKVAYAATPEGRSALKQAKRQWRERNRVDRAAGSR